VIRAESDTERDKTVPFVRESMLKRLNDEMSAIIVMQRLHENNASDDILAREANYCRADDPHFFDRLG
jgi:hypothetical protein